MQNTAYEMRISGWSSDLCSSDLPPCVAPSISTAIRRGPSSTKLDASDTPPSKWIRMRSRSTSMRSTVAAKPGAPAIQQARSARTKDTNRSEEHTSELQSLMRISYAVFCLKKKNTHNRGHRSDRMDNISQT